MKYPALRIHFQAPVVALSRKWNAAGADNLVPCTKRLLADTQLLARGDKGKTGGLQSPAASASEAPATNVVLRAQRKCSHSSRAYHL